jgi:GTPase SAR1 family protein
MSFRQPDFYEQQEKDEEELLNDIDTYNMSFKDCCYKENNFTDCLSKQSTNESFDLTSKLKSENFYAFDETIKVMLLGNKSAGKTAFLNSLLDNMDSQTEDKGGKNSPILIQRDVTKPTLSLEISKRLLIINKKIINLEFWDTNEQMLNSSIIKSKIYLILAYIKICNCFLLLCDNTDYSIKFIEKQLDNIIRHAVNPNVLILVNNKYQDSNKKVLSDLAEKYGVGLASVNSFSISYLESYLSKSLSK